MSEVYGIGLGACQFQEGGEGENGRAAPPDGADDGRPDGRRETHLPVAVGRGRAISIPQSRGRTSYSSGDCAVAQQTFLSQLVSCYGKPATASELRWQRKKLGIEMHGKL